MLTNLMRGYDAGGGKEALVAAKMGLRGNKDEASRSDAGHGSGSLSDGNEGKGTEMGLAYKCGQKRPFGDEDPLLQGRKKVKEVRQQQSQDDDRLPCLMQAAMVKTPNCSFDYEPHFDVKVSDSFFDDRGAARSTLNQESSLPTFNTAANVITTAQSRPPFSLENLIEATSSKDSKSSDNDMMHQPAQLSAPQPYQSTSTFDQGSYSAMLQLPRSLGALSVSDFSTHLNMIKTAILRDIKTTSSEEDTVHKICTLQSWAKFIATRPMKEE
ncbi:hypothetical protein THAOC_07471 [Thalassiosira oceanica]|uniref:Uncharacterized protein n=1 Tax=Thalassiosira oceanica TaxID=159749 RepID=K0TCD7_THAOC|nr:hypothetical protein THAOC_07471 [Thalassiosira oceanica]|eukprot:EJK71121.1 hypothetical protein THAOC_07471 [Thalassiosira oceanica]